MFIITLRTAHKGKPLVTSFSRLLLSVLLFPEELEPCFFSNHQVDLSHSLLARIVLVRHLSHTCYEEQNRKCGMFVSDGK